MGKYERMQKRKQRKDAERRERARIHEGGNDERVDHTKGRGHSTWRRDQNGNIIFKNYIKFSRLSFIMIIGIVVIAVVLIVAIVTNTEQADSCANPFCALFGMEAGETKFAPPTSGTTEARELP